MLTEQYRRLLTAYVDGELSARQMRQVLKLLRRSAEARRLLHQLQSDSRQLRALPRINLDHDLSGPILQAIARRPRPPRRPAAAPVSVSVWPAVVAAAAILVMIAGTSYLYFANLPLPDARDQQHAEQKPPTEDGPQPPKTTPEPRDTDRRPDMPSKDSTTEPKPDKGPDKTPGPVEIVKEPKIYGPPEELIPSYPLTDRFLEILDFKMEMQDPPLTVRLHDLDQEGMRSKLRARLDKGTAFRMEMPVQSASKALERLRIVLRGEQIGLTLDAAAAAKHKSSRYTLFLENVTPDDLTHICQQLGAADKKAARRDIQFDRLFVSRLGDKDHKEMQRSLGLDPTSPAPNKAKKATMPEALVLPYPATRSSFSREVKRFLEHRKPARPGTLQVLLVLQSV
jgi:hypothetical protein